jgi:hypothetical protein
MAPAAGTMRGMTPPPAPPATDSVSRRLLRWLPRVVAVAALVALAQWLEHALGGAALRWLAAVAGLGAVAALLAIGAGFARRGDILASQTLDWLLLGPWTVLFVLGLWGLGGLLAAGPLRALLAAAAATLASAALAMLGALLRRGKAA